MLPTTDGAIYTGNLNAQVDALRRLQDGQADALLETQLARLLYHRFQLQGRLGDAESARSIMASLDSINLLQAGSRLTYAQVLTGFHAFKAAKAQILAAEKANGDAESIKRARQRLSRALELPDTAAVVEPPIDYVSAVQQAALRVDQGDLGAATRLLQKAQALYRDSNPYPLAWIYVQQGIAFLRFERFQDAKIFFSAARERLPEYYVATEHLAETEGLLGNSERSAELYRAVTTQTGHPAFWHGLAEAEASLGNEEAAKQAAVRAADGYKAAIQRYPLMYADHAVSYYLDIGDAAFALELARQNYDERRDVASHLTLADALLANGRQDEACALVADLRDAGFEPPEVLLSSNELSRCTERDARTRSS